MSLFGWLFSGSFPTVGSDFYFGSSALLLQTFCSSFSIVSLYHSSDVLIIKPNCFFFPEDIKIFRTVTSATDCVLLQTTHIDYTRGWCAVNSMGLNSDQSRLITLTRKIIIAN